MYAISKRMSRSRPSSLYGHPSSLHQSSLHGHPSSLYQPSLYGHTSSLHPAAHIEVSELKSAAEDFTTALQPILSKNAGKFDFLLNLPDLSAYHKRLTMDLRRKNNALLKQISVIYELIGWSEPDDVPNHILAYDRISAHYNGTTTSPDRFDSILLEIVTKLHVFGSEYDSLLHEAIQNAPSHDTTMYNELTELMLNLDVFILQIEEYTDMS